MLVDSNDLDVVMNAPYIDEYGNGFEWHPELQIYHMVKHNIKNNYSKKDLLIGNAYKDMGIATDRGMSRIPFHLNTRRSDMDMVSTIKHNGHDITIQKGNRNDRFLWKVKYTVENPD